MFTGIVEEIGIIKEFVRHNNGADIVVECSKTLKDAKLGDSIAINGCCQTVVEILLATFKTNVSNETLNITTFKDFKKGQKVNLERALTPTSRMGGHIVQGHVDGVGRFVKFEKYSEFYDLYFDISNDLTKYIVKKGSISIDGVSLTVAEIKENTIKVAIIPHTFENTTLSLLNNNDFVNIETDILGRYVEKLLYPQDNNSKIDENFLKENGFL